MIILKKMKGGLSMLSDSEKKKGISLRKVYLWLMVIAFVIFGLTMFSVYLLTSTFFSLSDSAKEHSDLEKAAHELMDASDYLTENTQRFTIDGDMKFLNKYFAEAFENNRREEAIQKMSSDQKYSKALKQLQEAMDASVTLMNQEYYSMKLVIEAKGYTDYPDILKSIKLNDEDSKLSPESKMQKATTLVLNDDYYNQKEEIRQNMKESLNELEVLSQNEENHVMMRLQHQLILICIMSIIQTAVILFLIVLTSHLGIKPVLKAVEKIKDDDPIPEIGANEFRYLAKTYNKMYAIYKGSLERLNFKASHDELTGAYNRSGYELLLSSVDMSNTHLLLFDLDNFKSINDNFGHETGDKVLKKLVNTLKCNFRTDDYICRIGGDEFVVFMVNTTQMQKDLISHKIEKINAELGNTTDGLPAFSVSVGIAHGTNASNSTNLFEKADQAMYKSKQSGKRTYTFYSG